MGNITRKIFTGSRHKQRNVLCNYSEARGNLNRWNKHVSVLLLGPFDKYFRGRVFFYLCTSSICGGLQIT